MDKSPAYNNVGHRDWRGGEHPVSAARTEIAPQPELTAPPSTSRIDRDDPVTTLVSVKDTISTERMRAIALEMADIIQTHALDEAKLSLAVLAANGVPHIQGLIENPGDPFHTAGAEHLGNGIEAALTDNAIGGYENAADPERVTSSVRAFAIVLAIGLSRDPLRHPMLISLLDDPSVHRHFSADGVDGKTVLCGLLKPVE